jgi:hypothetical protein
MKAKFIFTAFLSFTFYLLFSQVPQGFNYQAIVRNTSGDILQNKNVKVKVAIHTTPTGGAPLWDEEHALTTSQFGLVTFVVGTGSNISGTLTDFSKIPWAAQTLYLRTYVQYPVGGSYTEMGTTQIWSVPYSLVAKDIVRPIDSLTIKSKSSDLNDAIFEVKNKNGQTVFAVYNEGVRVYVSDGKTKGLKGGFAVGGFGTDTKAESTKYLFVDKDSVRIYLDTNPLTKGLKGTFAVGGYDLTKGPGSVQNYLNIGADSIRMYIDKSSKGLKGGFAVGGFDMTKGGSARYLNIATDASGIINPSQNRILWYPIKNAFLTGKVLIESSANVGENSFSSGYESKAKGNWSQALGYKTIANGDYSTAIGKNAVANSINSFAFGENAQTKNSESYAFGRGAIAEGFRSFAFGSAAIDSANQITGIAYAKGYYSFAVGQGSQAIGLGAFALGIADTAIGNYSVAMGYKTSSKAYYSTSMGYSTVASSGATFAAGYLSQASGWASTSIGYKSLARGSQSVSIGSNTLAQGDFSFASGVSTSATGINSVAMGGGTISSGVRAFSVGENSIAQGNCSFAGGKMTSATGSASTAFGTETKASGGASFAAGYQSESSGWAATSLGYKAVASGDQSVSIGSNTLAKGIYSFASGVSTSATGNSSTAMGLSTIASGQSSASFGRNTKANSFASFVLGQYNDTTCISSTGWNLADPVFIIGNGLDDSNRSNALTVLKNGFVGIGISTPSSKLHVNGNISLQGGTILNLSGSVGVGNTSSGWYSDASNLSARFPGASGDFWVQNAGGTIHYLRVGAGIAGLRLFTGNAIFDNSVGIGTLTPAYKLHVNGPIYASSVQIGNSSGPITENWWEFGIDNGGGAGIDFHSNIAPVDCSARIYRNPGNNGIFQIVNVGTGNMEFAPANTTRMIITSNGLVGIGITAPSHILHINGIGRSTSATWDTSSDMRVKKNIHKIEYGLEKIIQLNPVSFQYSQEYIDQNFSDFLPKK